MCMHSVLLCWFHALQHISYRIAALVWQCLIAMLPHHTCVISVSGFLIQAPIGPSLLTLIDR